MKIFLKILAFVSVTLTAGPALAGGKNNWSVGVSLAGPGCYPRPYGGCAPWCGPCYGWNYYRYRPYYPMVVAPLPVIVQPAPVYQPIVQPIVQQPIVQPATVQAAPAALSPAIAKTAHVDSATQESALLAQLADPDEQIRQDVVMQLGRMKSAMAIDPLAATLAGDRSPTVRDAAARALGLIGSSKALPALQHAAQADQDRDVRRSAQFAVDVVRSR